MIPGERGCPRHRGAARAVAVVLLAAGGACGGGDGEGSGGDGAADTDGPAISAPELAPARGETGRAAPRWEEVAVLSGTGATETAPFTIAEGAVQWRARWSCEVERLVATPRRSPGAAPGDAAEPLLDGECPGTGEGFSIATGELRLTVEASGPWQATVEQQVDTPIDELPLPGMDAAPVLAEGSFYAIDEEGSGEVRLYQLPDGSRALRFEDFEVFLNVDLVVWLSEASRPTTSAEAVDAPYVEIAPLKSTIGPQNYPVPDDLATADIASVVIWCPPIASAYLGATLSP